MEKFLEISSFYISVPIIMIRWCMVPEIWCVTDVIVISHIGLFFTLLLPLTAQKINILKKWKKKQQQKSLGDIINLHMCIYQKLWSDDVWFLRYGVQQTDGQKKWHIEVGVPPKKWYKKKHHSNKFLICLLVGCTKFHKSSSRIWKVISPTSEWIYLFEKKTFFWKESINWGILTQMSKVVILVVYST